MSEVPTITINGKLHEIGDGLGPNYRLVNFLHHNCHLRGTHITCYDGGCGGCMVVASVPNPATGDNDTYSVNSCLVPVLSCAGWEITTVEGLGSSQEGYHVIQDRLAEYSGTQCGYCSPGFVMSMHGLTQDNPSWTASDVEKCLDANICRCTGYRPIVEAFKSITHKDIEDAHLARCPNTGKPCTGQCSKDSAKGKTKTSNVSTKKKCYKGKGSSNTNWYQPATLQELYDIMAGLVPGDRYSLICGNTAQAVVGRDFSSKATIFTRNVPELSQVTQTSDTVVFGANVSISHMMTEMKSKAATLEGFAYLEQLVDAWCNLAGASVRNLGSWAGNLAVRILHKDFPSDIFTHLVATGATVTLGSTDGSTTSHSLEDLLEVDLVAERKVILKLTLPKMNDDVVFRVFKVSPRPTNAHGYVNAGFRMQVDATHGHTVVGTPVIVFGCINSTFVHATATEAVLANKNLEDESVIQAAMTALASEVIPDESPLEPSAEYKVALTQNMLYKTILGIIGDVASVYLMSGATDLKRPLSSGKQTFDQNRELWPLAQPIPKLEAHIQCSGEADYVTVAPSQLGELFGYFVTSKQANARIVSIDPSAALKMPGVVAFIGREDITGQNNIHSFGWNTAEPLFPEERVSYYGQPLGLLVTEGRGPAYQAAAAVEVTYDDIQPPILTVDEALQHPLPPGQPNPFIQGDVSVGFAASSHIVEGTMRKDGQYHFCLETQACIVTPTDEGLDVLIGTQWSSETQRSIGQVLGIPDNLVNVTVKKVGGAFGSRVDRCNILATAAALAAQKTRRRVRLSLDFGDNMTIIGWREPFTCTYKAGVDDAGVLQAVQATLTCDSGFLDVNYSSGIAVHFMPSCYASASWELTPQFVLTNTACNTAFRSPGVAMGMSLLETIFDHLATVTGIDPVELRRKNLMADGGTRPLSNSLVKLRAAMAGVLDPEIPEEIKVPKNLISDMIDQIMVSADVDARKQAVEQFNQNNKWKKRGIALMPEMFIYGVPPSFPFIAMVSINARDGTVSVSHGGTEMGQGINTKVAQCAAYELGIPLDMIAIKSSNTHTNANSQLCSGNHGADIASFSVTMASRNLKERLDAFKKTLPDPSIAWPDLVLQAYNNGIDISEHYANKLNEVKGYNVFAVGVSEVEVDVLTGQYLLLRTDILEDAGRSVSPLVDIGQVEGGFVMGQGLFTTERPIYDPRTGQRLTNSTWNYKPPLTQDIPVDFRVTLLHDAPNPLGVQSSKITGEPPLNLSFSIVMALRQAITSARADGGTTGWFQIDTPLTVDKIQQLCQVDSSRLAIL